MAKPRKKAMLAGLRGAIASGVPTVGTIAGGLKLAKGGVGNFGAIAAGIGRTVRSTRSRFRRANRVIRRLNRRMRRRG